MKLLDQSAKTNWRFIGIVAFVAVFLAGGVLMLIPQLQEQPPPLPQQNTSQIETPSSPSNSVEGWQTYRSDEFGFEVKYPKELQVGVEAPNSVLGTYQDPVKGLYVGPLVFVIASNDILKEQAQSYIERYLDVAENPEKGISTQGASISCYKHEVTNTKVNIAMVDCTGEGGPGVYALLKGHTYDIFVDGYSAGFDALGQKMGSLREGVNTITQILSTFRFIE